MSSTTPSSGAATPVSVGDDLTTTPPELPLNKAKGRHRLLRGLQRMSSTPSLTNLRRARSHSAPYRSSTRSTLSCVSLAAAGPPQVPGSARAATPQPGLNSSSSSRPATPMTEFPFPHHVDTELAIRKVENGRTILASGTATLPTDVKLPRSEAMNRMRATSAAAQMPPFKFWDKMPSEVQVHIFSFLEPKELVRASSTSKTFHKLAFDGQLWRCLDASEFYQEIPAEALSRIILAAGPFIKDLNLRGCVQVEHYKRAEVIVKACKNLMNATLEGCRNFQKTTLHSLLESNDKLVHLNLTGLPAVSNKSCQIIAGHCPQLETFNVSWCSKVDARGIKFVIEGCEKLIDVRAGEVRGFDRLEVARTIFKTNNLEKLVLSGCSELTDEALKVMMHGSDPEVDILTGIPIVPPRKLRHLDLSRCSRLSDAGVKAIGHLTPDLEGLQLSRLTSLTDAALEPILASTPRLRLLELEDLENLTNSLLSEHLAKAPCATTLEHLSLSCCENLGDVGMLPVMKNCVGLRSVDLDNTRVSDLVCAEAASMVMERSETCLTADVKPKTTLRIVVYDCQNVTWTGIREILFRNAHLRPASGHSTKVVYPTEVISIKCFYGYQMTVDEHQKRVLRGDFIAARKLEKKWGEYMQATEEMGLRGSGSRRRRRRARDAHAVHMNEEDGVGGRRRARTMGTCYVM